MSYKYVLHGDLSSKNKFNCRVEDGNAEDLRKNYISDQFLYHPLLKSQSSYPLCYYIQVYSDTSIGMSFYLRNGVYQGDNIGDNLDNSIAQVQYHIDFGNEDQEDNEVTIKWVSVKTGNRGKGLAKFLLSLALINSHIINSSIKNTRLDDDSDAYANGIDDINERRKKQSRNLYCRMGYKYEDPSGGPEMIGNIKKMISDIESRLKKRKAGTKKKKRKSSSSKRRSKRRVSRKRLTKRRVSRKRRSRRRKRSSKK